MNVNKHAAYFDPNTVTDPIHVIGVGAIGSTFCELLARLGIPAINIYDFDTVEEHNVANQLYTSSQIGTLKTTALKNMLLEINPLLECTCFDKGYRAGMSLSGIVILAVDSIDLRKEIVTAQMYNPNVKLIMDFRMRLEDAQHYAADWSNEKQRKNLLATMQFTEEEAREATPVNACGSTLAIAPTIRTVTSAGAANLINFWLGKPIKNTVLVNPFAFSTAAF